jgi:hypothetical protein
MSDTLSTNYFQSATISSETTTRITESLSGITFRKAIGAQHWLIDLTSKPLDRAEQAELFAFLVKQEGMLGHFNLVPPIYGSTRSTNATGTPTVTTDFAAGVNSVKANGGGGSLKTGDYIKFSNHNKVYLLTADVNQDLSSEDTFEFTPRLEHEVDNTTTIIYNNVPFKVMLMTDRLVTNTGADGNSVIQISVAEDH